MRNDFGNLSLVSRTLQVVFAAILFCVCCSAQVTERRLSDGVVRYDIRRSPTQPPSFWRQVYDLFHYNSSKLPFERSVAFLVGVGQYRFLTPLAFVKTDVAEMRDYLLSQGGFDTVYVAQDDVVSAELVENYMVNKFPEELSPRDRLLFYFSGHGTDIGGQTGYMQFADAQPDLYRTSEYLAVTRCIEWSRINKVKHALFLLDSCVSGLGFEEKSGSSDVDEDLLRTFSGNGSRFVVTAGTSREKAFQVEKSRALGYGVFTRAFLNALRNKSRTSTDRGFVILDEVFADLKISVARFSAGVGRRMTPRLWAIPRDEDTDTGTFVFLNPGARKPLLAKSMESVLGVVPKSSEGQPTLKASSKAHMIVTPYMGLQFKQGGQVLPIFESGNRQFFVELRREAFTISLPERTWKKPDDDYPALQITVSDSSELLNLVIFNDNSDNQPFFWPGTGMADYMHGSGGLIAITNLSERPFSHNYIIGNRFNVQEVGRRGIYVAAIPKQEDDLLRTAENIYMVFHLKSPSGTNSFAAPRLDRNEVELIRLNLR